MHSLHNVCFVNSSHAASLVVPGVLKGVLSNASAGVLCDQLDALHHTIHNLP